MLNEFYTVFVSETGRHDHTAFLWVETKDKNIYLKALAAAKERGLKVSKEYKPADNLSAPDFTKCINIK